MKIKLIDLFESFFQPETPGPRNKHHVRPGNLKRSFNNFPYQTQDQNQRVSEEQIEQELEIGDDGILANDSGVGGGE